MKTAIDTNVLLDVLLHEPQFWWGSANALKAARAAGELVICELVYAELATQFWSIGELDDVLRRTGIKLESVNASSAFLTGRMWHEYRRRGGQRKRILTDFLIGAHAREQADRLLTRDDGFYRDYFRGLKIFDPVAAN